MFILLLDTQKVRKVKQVEESAIWILLNKIQSNNNNRNNYLLHSNLMHFLISNFKNIKKIKKRKI
jgi:hypothetical protein